MHLVSELTLNCPFIYTDVPAVCASYDRIRELAAAGATVGNSHDRDTAVRFTPVFTGDGSARIVGLVQPVRARQIIRADTMRSSRPQRSRHPCHVAAPPQ